MRTKNYRLSANKIKPVAIGYGGCYASDRITVDGCKVGYMYREEPDFKEDGGWRFLAGDETNEYMDNTSNFGIYDVNTIANYDIDIVPLLESDAGSAYARDTSGQLVAVPFAPNE